MKPGDAVIEALRDQGFDVEVDDVEVRVQSIDGRRIHRIPEAIFSRNAAFYMESLRLVVLSLELIEGFVPPAQYRD